MVIDHYIIDHYMIDNNVCHPETPHFHYVADANRRIILNSGHRILRAIENTQDGERSGNYHRGNC